MTMNKSETELFIEARDRATKFEEKYWKGQNDIDALRRELEDIRAELYHIQFVEKSTDSKLERALGWIDCKMDKHPTGKGKGKGKGNPTSSFGQY